MAAIMPPTKKSRFFVIVIYYNLDKNIVVLRYYFARAKSLSMTMFYEAKYLYLKKSQLIKLH